MTVRLIPDDEVVDVCFGNTKFLVRHLNLGHTDDCTRRANSKGKHDHAAYERILWDLMIVGWEGLEDSRGKAVAYTDDPEKKFAIMRGLPTQIATRIRTAAYVSIPEEESALGNSAPSSASA